jgi:hypothetical protein
MNTKTVLSLQGDKVRSIMGGLFRDIVMKEMNLKE